MVYRYRKLGDDWSEPMLIGQTVQHSTALTIDSAGRLWIFYIPPKNVQAKHLAKGEDEQIFVGVVDSATNEIVSTRCLLRVPPAHQVMMHHAIPWIAAPYGASDQDQVALIWMEGPGDPYRVMFRTFNHMPDPPSSDCAE